MGRGRPRVPLLETEAYESVVRASRAAWPGQVRLFETRGSGETHVCPESPCCNQVAPKAGGERKGSERGLKDNDVVPRGRISDEKRSRPIRGMKWTEIALPTCLILVVAVPVMVVEEDWHGHPMIDESTHLWILPAALVTLAFFCGGGFAGFRRPSTAALSALAVASIALDGVTRLCSVSQALGRPGGRASSGH